MAILSIGISRPHHKKPFSEAVKFVEGTDFSHIFISWKDEQLGVRKVAEARGAGGRMISNKEFKRCNEVVGIYHYEVDEDQLRLIEKWLWLNLGQYGWKSIFGLLIMRGMSLVNKIIGRGILKPKNPFKDGLGSQVCCEVALRALFFLGIKPEGNIEDFGLKETEQFLKITGMPADQDHIDKVNGVNNG